MTKIAEIMAEFVERSAGGEQVDREACLTRFPEHADSLREFFKNFDVSDAISGAPNRRLVRQVCEVLPLLPEKDRTVIRMVQLESWSMDEVAVEMGDSRDAAAKRLLRALRRLGAKLAHGNHDHNR